MPKHFGYISSMIALAGLLSLPMPVMARGGGGGGGGHGGGGGGHFGGGAMGGGGGGGVARGGGGPGYSYRGYTGGNRGFAPGYHGYGYGRPGYVGRYGYGWGYPGYYGWGYPYYGYGLGLGVGLGYGLSAGYGYGYPVYAYPYSSTTVVYTAPASSAAAPVASPTSSPVVTTAAAEAPVGGDPVKAREFIERGDVAFKAADYETAVYAWRHAVVDDPQNPLLVLRLSQGLFALGKYQEAAGATQAALHQLPKDQWGAVVAHYQEFYGNSEDYTRQMQELEKAVKNKPDDPALRFLTGYHYGYLGFHKQSIEQLDKGVQLEARDEMAKKLRDEMKGQLALAESNSTTNRSRVTPASSKSTTWTKSK